MIVNAHPDGFADVSDSKEFRELALMGLANGSESSPNFLARPQSIRLSSAPESIYTSRSVVV